VCHFDCCFQKRVGQKITHDLQILKLLTSHQKPRFYEGKYLTMVVTHATNLHGFNKIKNEKSAF
jgi:hypothetical protein